MKKNGLSLQALELTNFDWQQQIAPKSECLNRSYKAHLQATFGLTPERNVQRAPQQVDKDDDRSR